MNLAFSCKYKGRNLNVDLKLRDHITVVLGESGTGKTFVEMMASLHDQRATYIDAITVTRIPDIFDDLDGKFLTSKKFIFIDNAEYVFGEYPKMITALNCDYSRRYIVYLRKPVNGLEVPPWNFAKMMFEDTTNTFSLEYLY